MIYKATIITYHLHYHDEQKKMRFIFLASEASFLPLLIQMKKIGVFGAAFDDGIIRGNVDISCGVRAFKLFKLCKMFKLFKLCKSGCKSCKDGVTATIRKDHI